MPLGNMIEQNKPEELQNLVKSEETPIYQTTNLVDWEELNALLKQMKTNLDSTSTSLELQEHLKQIVEKMNILALEQNHVSRSFSILQEELEKAQESRQKAIKSQNGYIQSLEARLKDLREQVKVNQKELQENQIQQFQQMMKDLEQLSEKWNKENRLQAARTESLRQDLLKFVTNLKQESKPTLKETLMVNGLKTGVVVLLTSTIWVLLTLLTR